MPANESSGKTLQDIWSICGSNRLIVAWNTDNPDSYMWPGVNPCWYQGADSLKELYKAIKADIQNPPSGMWVAYPFMEPGKLEVDMMPDLDGGFQIYGLFTARFYTSQ